MSSSDLDRAINEHSEAFQFRQQSLKQYYTRKIVDIRIGPVGYVVVGTQLVALLFFCSLYVMSFIPQTKAVVSVVLP